MNKKILIVMGMAIIGLGIGTIIGLQQIKNTKITTASPGEDQKQVIKSKIEELQQEQQKQIDEIWEKEKNEGCTVASISNCEEMPQILAVLKGKEALVNANWQEENKGFSTMEYTSKKNDVFTFFIPASRANDTEAIERMKQTLDEGGKYEVDSNMTYFEDTCRYGEQTQKRREILASNETCRKLEEERQKLHDEFSKEISDYRRQLDLLNARPEAEQQKAMDAIRKFMARPDLELEYLRTSSPSNFNVGVITNQTDNGYTMEDAEGWDRKVEVYQQKEYIGNTCEVYEYEVDVRNNEIVQVGIRYPQEGVIANPKKQEDCPDTHSLETPILSMSEIKEAAMGYLQRGVKNFDEIKDEFVYEGSAINPKVISSHNAWIWEDKDYKLPEGLYAEAPSKVPTIWSRVSCGGYLIMYLNTTGLFN